MFNIKYWWRNAFSYIGDAVPAMMIACIVFIIPKQLPTCSSVEGIFIVFSIMISDK